MPPSKHTETRWLLTSCGAAAILLVVNLADGRHAPMNPLRPLSHVADVYRRHGWRRAAYEAELVLGGNWMSISDRRLEHQFGLETRHEVTLDDLIIRSPNRPHGFMYVGTPVTTFDCIMANVAGNKQEFSFVDLGSGKGRTLVMAAEHGFGRVIGVEFSAELHAVAQQNVQRYHERKARRDVIELVHGDAVEFGLPESDSVLYFNNPFNEHVMAAVLDNVITVHAGSGRRIMLIYHQLREDLESHSTHNLAMLRRHPRLSEQRLVIASWHRRWLTRLFSIGVFELDTRS